MKPYIFLFLLLCSTSLFGQNDPNLFPEVSLEDAGFNRDSINTLLEQIQTTRHGDFRGLVVIKDNELVLEEYYNTFWRNTIHDIRSAGKSITALLLGVALKEGLIDNLDQSVYSLFSEERNERIHEDYKKVKLRDILDMSSGLDADTDSPKTRGHAGQWIARDDWKEYLLNIPMVEKPGERWVYADMNALLIGLAIEEASGMSLRDYAQKRLFSPMGIEQVYWYTNAANQTGAAGNLYLTTLDFAKLGWLVANNGAWGDTQLMDEAYLKKLIAHKKFDLAPFAESYGFLWYKTTGTFRGKEVEYLFAAGNGGNQLVVFPEQNMVIALTSSAYGQPYGHGRSFYIVDKILSAAE
jgi:CubicO group peptidase (beta-lactamase class C family)